MSLLGVLWSVLFQQPEQHIGLIFIQSSRELSNKWRHFYSGQQNSLLPLEGNILGPSHKPSEISFGLNIVSHSEVPRSALKERMSFSFSLLDCSFTFDSFALGYWIFTIGSL